MGQIATPFVLSQADLTTLNNLLTKGKESVRKRNERAVRIHWSFTVAIAEDTLKRWHEQVNPVNKPQMSIN